MKKELVITFSPEGEAEAEVFGTCGPECQKLLDQLAGPLGPTRVRRPKPELYRREGQQLGRPGL